MAIKKLKTKHKYKTFSIETLGDYVELVDRCFSNDPVLFRGQREDKPLLPRIARVKPRTSILYDEKAMLDALARESVGLIGHNPETEWDWLALAQHHGMATRLLDWTTNPLAGLWFAVEKPAEAPTDSGVVWVFDPKDEDLVNDPKSQSPFSGQFTKVFIPRHVTARIRAQSGAFTVHKYIKTKKTFIPFDNNPRYQGRLVKICVPGGCFSNLRWDLDRYGVNSFSLFPDIDGLCRHQTWRNSLSIDELPD